MSDSNWASCSLFHYSGPPSCSLECFCQFLSLKSHLFARWVVLSWSFVVDLSPSSHHLLYIHCNSCTVVSPVCTSSFHLVVPFYAICAIDQKIPLSHWHCVSMFYCLIIWVHLLRLIECVKVWVIYFYLCVVLMLVTMMASSRFRNYNTVSSRSLKLICSALPCPS